MIPWVIIAGAGAESLYAWYDPDFFTSGLWAHADADRQVETLNNYWQHLWRAAGGVIDLHHPFMKKLDYDTAGWEGFRGRYNDAIFRRAADPFALWGAQADLERELEKVWLPRFDARFREFVALDPRIREGLEARGVDPEPLIAQILDTDAPNWGLYLGVGLTLSLLGLGAVLAYRVRPRRVLRTATSTAA